MRKLSVMTTVTVLVVVFVARRLYDWHTRVVSPNGVAVLTVVMMLLASVGATFGGSLVFESSVNGEPGGHVPVWHESETDLYPHGHD